MREIVKILDIPFDVVTKEMATKKVIGFLDENKPHMVCTPNPEIVMIAQEDSLLKEILEKADLVIPDGIGVVWASKYFGKKMTERVAGYELLLSLFEYSPKKEMKFYFLGGGKNIAVTAAKKLKEQYAQLNIVGAHDGYFDKNEEQLIIEQINQSGCDIVLVGLGCPKQEKWMYENAAKLKAKVLIGVGGSFDGMAGVVPRAPKIFIKFGLEWFYRLLKQPKRFVRMLKLPIFVINVLLRHVSLKCKRN